MARTEELAAAARGRRARERVARRDSILAAAQETFTSRGFAGSTMEEVALRAEITKPTLYGYFRSKDEILLSLIQPVLVEIAEQLEEVRQRLVAGALEQTEDLITAFLEALLTPYYQDPERFRLTQLLHQTRLVESLDAGSLAELDTQGRTAFTVARAIFRTAQERGVIRDTPVGPLADLVWSVAVGTIQVEDIKARTGGRAQFAATIRLATELLAVSLAPL
ncbi:TetR/AcrR family transcriptional regulator [Tomitella fengzijianii]|uniref:TetR/AcrR family transcriptional regulator n=1 Tax=Tomitella fengzijianii TaxID=2597660 RepID=UPI00131CB37B|nr:TetR/AcrR family transcriptional regulator [Tomitella fengzijianii]